MKRLIYVEIQLKKPRQILEHTQQQLETKAPENKFLDRIVKDLKKTVEVLRNEVNSLKANRGTIPNFRALTYHFCTPNLEYMTPAYSNNPFFT